MSHRTVILWFVVVSVLWGELHAVAAATEQVTAPTRPLDVRQRNMEMKRRVDTWLKGGRAVQSPVHVVYLTCSDQKPFANHRQRLNRVLTEIQKWFALQHEAAGFGKTTLALERGKDGLIRLHEGTLPFAVGTRNRGNKLQSARACASVARKLLQKVGVNYDRSFVLMLTTIPDDHAAAPFFGNIIQDRGYCFAVDTPWLDSNYTQVTGQKVWKGKRIGPANSALIGGISHELGHGLGLPHSDEPVEEKRYGESLMASGNYTWRQEQRGEGKGSYLLDTDAMLLISRPPFTGRVRDFDKQPKAIVDAIRIDAIKDGRVRVTGLVKSDIPVYAVKLYDDPPGNGDYNAVAHAALPDETTGQFTITFRPVTAAGEHQLRLYLYHVNGRWTTRRQTVISVNRNGSIDVSRARAVWSK